MVVVDVEKVGFAFSENWLFKDVSIKVNQGDFVAIVGPNGSGKSTFLRLLTKMLTPALGQIKLFDIPMNQFTDWHKIGYISQYPAQQQKNFPITVKEVVSMGLLSRRKSFLPWISDLERQQVQEKLELVGLWHLKDNLIGNLSGGQKQRVFLARALTAEAEVLLLDEPTSGIDADAKNEIYKLLKDLNKEKKTTIIMVSHDMELAANTVDKALCLEAGGVCYWGGASEIMKHRHKKGYYYHGGIATNGDV